MTACLVAFCTDKSDWISTLIRWATWDRFSHVGLVSPDRSAVIEATHGVGVREVPFDEFMLRDGVELRMIPHSDPDDVWARARSQIGKPYDWADVYGILFRQKNWQDTDAWSCAELIAWSGDWFSRDMNASISPRDLHLISQPYRRD
jgi:uncharacterized protein YycO